MSNFYIEEQLWIVFSKDLIKLYSIWFQEKIMRLLLRNKISSIWYCIVTPLIIKRVIDFFLYSICISKSLPESTPLPCVPVTRQTLFWTRQTICRVQAHGRPATAVTTTAETICRVPSWHGHGRRCFPVSSRQWWGHYLPCAWQYTAQCLPWSRFAVCLDLTARHAWTSDIVGPNVCRVSPLPCPPKIYRVFVLGKKTIWSKSGLPGSQIHAACPVCRVQVHGRGLLSPLPCACTR
jgi:hypothetical protein